MVSERQKVTRYGIIEGFILAVVFLFMLIMLSVRRSSFTIKKEHKTDFTLMIAWILILIVALLGGVVFGNNFNYMIGGFYKFMCLCT